MRFAILAGLLALPFPAMGELLETSSGKVEVEAVVTGLDTPWAVAFLPEGNLLITERDSGILWRIDAEGERVEVRNLPAIDNVGQGGLLDVVVARDFDRTGEIFLTYSARQDGGTATSGIVARLAGDALTDIRPLGIRQAGRGSGRHFGARVVEDREGALFVTLGDRGDRPLAQELDVLPGKILRLNRDGTPAGAGIAGAKPEIWSYGHRNPQGAALDADGQLWTVEHGARGGDEINMPRPGRNYGWPVISYGTHYSGGKIGEGTARTGMEQPVWYWDPSIAPSGMAVYSGKLWPEWEGDIFVGSLKFDFISRLDRDRERIVAEERLLEDRFERIRDVREGPDGAIWFLSEGDGTLYRMTPAR